MAQRETVQNMSNSNKQNTNKESVSYLAFVSNDSNHNHLDCEEFLVCDSLEEIINKIQIEWSILPEDFDVVRVLPIKMSQLKRIKQTPELV